MKVLVCSMLSMSFPGASEQTTPDDTRQKTASLLLQLSQHGMKTPGKAEAKEGAGFAEKNMFFLFLTLFFREYFFCLKAS